jgi:hypothetical protein
MARRLQMSSGANDEDAAQAVQAKAPQGPLLAVINYQFLVSAEHTRQPRPLSARVIRILQGIGLAAVLLILVAYTRSALSYGVGTPSDPGAGFFPLVAVIVLAVGIIGIVVRRVRGNTAPEPATEVTEHVVPEPGGQFRATALLVLSVLYVLVIGHLGDLLSGICFVGLVLIAMGNRLWVAVVGGVAVGFAAHYIFVNLLSIPLGHGSGL